MSLSLTGGPATEPVTLAELKAQMKVNYAAEDTRLTEMVIPTARQLAEAHTGRAFITQTWVLTLRGFGVEPILIPRPPLVSITSVRYVDAHGATQTWTKGATGYQLDQPTGAFARFATLQPAYGVSWPTTRDIPGAVTITFEAGYGAAAAVPQGIKDAILLWAEGLYRLDASLMEIARGVLMPFRAKYGALRVA